MDVSILVLWLYGICDLMSPPLLYWVYPGRNCRETSQWSFLVKASWHAPLICPLATEKEEENWTQLRTETLFKELLNWKRVLALNAQIYDSISATVWAPSTEHQLQLESQTRRVPVQRAGWRHFSPFWTESVWRWCQLMMAEGEKLGELCCKSCTLEFSVGCLSRSQSFPGPCTDLK